MQSKYELVESEGCEIKIRAEVTNQEFEQAVKDAYRKNKMKFSVHGFRKGKAPKAVIERQYGEGVFYEDAINILLPIHYEAALKELGIKPVAKPDIDIENVEAGENFVFSAIVTVAPEIEIEGYKGLEIEEYIVEPSEEQIEAEIQRNREQNARIVTKPEGEVAEKGDTLNIDFVGSVDGVEFEGGSATGHDLKLGSGQFIPGFEDQLEGVKVGEDKVVSVKFPADYQNDSLADKASEFKVKVNKITTELLPDLDDEFAKDVSEYDTLDEYRESVKENLRNAAQEDEDRVLKERTVEKLINLVNEDIPQKMIDAETDNMLNNFSNQLRRQGLSLDQYAEYVGGMDTLKESMSKDSIKRIKQDLALNKIVKLEAIEIGQEEVDEEIKRFAEERKTKVEEIKHLFEGESLEYLKEDLAVRKALDLVVEAAKQIPKEG